MKEYVALSWTFFANPNSRKSLLRIINSYQIQCTTHIQSRATESLWRRRRRKVVEMVVVVVVNYYIAQRENEECLIYLQQQRVNPAPGKEDWVAWSSSSSPPPPGDLHSVLSLHLQQQPQLLYRCSDIPLPLLSLTVTPVSLCCSLSLSLTHNLNSIMINGFPSVLISNVSRCFWDLQKIPVKCKNQTTCQMLFVSLLKNKKKETQKKQREKRSIQDRQRGTERDTIIKQKQ